jgi:hypothetical protein
VLITLSWLAVVALIILVPVQTLKPVALVLVDLEQELDYLLRQEQITQLPLAAEEI